MLSGVKPKTFADSACTHSASGGLSTVITPAESNEPKRKFDHDVVIERTAAL